MERQHANDARERAIQVRQDLASRQLPPAVLPPTPNTNTAPVLSTSQVPNPAIAAAMSAAEPGMQAQLAKLQVHRNEWDDHAKRCQRRQRQAYPSSFSVLRKPPSASFVFPALPIPQHARCQRPFPCCTWLAQDPTLASVQA